MDAQPPAPASPAAPAPPSALVPGLVVAALTIAAVVCHHRGLTGAGLACSAAALLAAAGVGCLGGGRGGRILPALALITAAVALLRAFGDGLWPCPVACQGGGAYQRLLGFPTWAWGVAGALAVAAAALAARRAAAPRWLAAWAAGAAWVMAGGAIFYLWTAWLLGLRCGFCFAVHTGICAAVLLTLRVSPPRWWAKPILLFAGFAALFILYAPAPTEEPRPQPAPATKPERHGMSEALQRTEALRRLGRVGAPLQVEIAIDLHCPHCATTLGPLLDGLAPAVADGRVVVVQRFLTHAADPKGRELAAYALSSADAKGFAMLVSLLLGTQDDRGWSEVRSRVAEITDPAAIERRRAADTGAVDVVLAADLERLAKVRCTRTPFVLLSKQDGSEVGRWESEQVDPAAVVAAVAAAAKP